MNIAIAGYGVEGKANYAYWSSDPSNTITIVDERPLEVIAAELPEGVKALTGEAVFQHLDGFDMVVRTAGLSPYKIHTDGTVWSGTNEFFARCPAPIVGVTGSKGKGTTASLIASMLEAAGKKVWLVGNIGLPGLDVLKDIKADDVVVYELSSFQLWDVQRSPQVAVVLHIEQEHLDIHPSMDDYVAAKANIARHQFQNDTLIYNANNLYARTIAEHSLAKPVPYPDTNACHIRDGIFYYGSVELCPINVIRLKGAHNVQNAIAAIDAVWTFTQDVQAIRDGLSSFPGLPHRLAFVRSVQGVDYYDDSIATTPSSAVAALRSFEGRAKVIILGGSYKGSDFSELAEELVSQRDNDNGVHVLLIGDEAERIANACDAAGFFEYETINEASEGQSIMQLCVARAAELSRPGSVVLLSPASASFGLFKNYVDRGEQYIAAVEALS